MNGRFLLALSACVLFAVLLPLSGRQVLADTHDTQPLSVQVAVCPEGYEGDDLQGVCGERIARGYDVSVSRYGSHDGDYREATPDEWGAAHLDIAGLTPGLLSMVISTDVSVSTRAVTCTGRDLHFEAEIAQTYAAIPVIHIHADNLADMLCRVYLYGFPGDDEALDIVYQSEWDEQDHYWSPRDLTIYVAECPRGYQGSSYFQDCFANPGVGYEFTVNSPYGKQETNPAGFTTFDLFFAPPGESTIHVYRGEPVVAVCTADGEPVEAAIGWSRSVFPHVTVQVPPEGHVRCDLYFVPGAIPADPNDPGTGGATITVHYRICPEEHFAGPDYYGACHDHPGANSDMYLEGPMNRVAKTDEAGNVTFANLPAGTYRILISAPGEFVDRTVFFCAAASNPGTAVTETNPVTMTDGDDIICDLYVIQASYR